MDSPNPDNETGIGAHHDENETPHFEECQCPIIPSTTPLPLSSRVPTASDPVIPGPCIYHHRLTTRESETAIFIQYAPEIDELKEVLSSGMVKFKRSGHGGHLVLKKATTEQMGEAQVELKALIKEREGMVQELWARFVSRWGGRVERRDDGTMFVVDEGRHVRDLDGEGEFEGKAKAKASLEEEPVDNGESDPYVRRMREVQARMDDLQVAEERKKAKRAKAGKAAEEYDSHNDNSSGAKEGS